MEPVMLVGPDGSKDVPVPSEQFPADNGLPAKFAAVLKECSGGSDVMCAVAGVAGPVLAVIHGAATVFGLDEAATDEINAKARRDLRKIANMVASEGGEAAQDERALDVALTWCTTPIVPTYSIGVHLVLGDLDEASSEVGSDLAWVFRLACARAEIDIWEQAPLLAVTCHALTVTGALTEAMLREHFQPPEAEIAAFDRLVSNASGSMGMERLISNDSNVSSHDLVFSRAVSPFVTDMLGHMDGGDGQPCSAGAAFQWARQVSEDNPAAPGGLRRQISPHVFAVPSVSPHRAPPSPVLEAQEEPAVPPGQGV